MALRLSYLCFDSHDPRLLAGFWAEALHRDVDDSHDAVVPLRPTDGTAFALDFLPVPSTKPKVEKNRIHLDLTTTSAVHQADTMQRLLELGARHVDIGQGSDEPHVVLADPEGNELCVIEPGNSFLAG